MHTLALSCDHCGAPLDVPDTTRFVTCRYCNVRLEVKHAGTAVYTEVLQKVTAIEQQLVEMQEDQALDRLDQEWASKEKELLGVSREPPSREGVAWTAGALAVIGLGMVVVAVVNRGTVMPGLSALGLAGVLALFGHASVDHYESTRQMFLARRDRLRRKSLERRQRVG